MSQAPQLWPHADGRPLLGANGTEAMSKLLPRGAAYLVDYMKVGPFMGIDAVAEMARSYPLMLHLDDTLSGHEPLDEATVERIQALVDVTGTPWTSEHIGFAVPDVDLDAALITQPASKALSRDAAMANIVRNARDLDQRLSVPLILENIPLFPNWAHVNVAEPEFVAEVIDRTGCSLLLDLAHARVTSDVLGLDVHDYVKALPLDRVVELHLSGPRPLRELDDRRQAIVLENAASVRSVIAFGEDSLVDAHEPMREEDYALLEWTLARCEPRAVSLEYYRDADALASQLVRLNSIVGRALPA